MKNVSKIEIIRKDNLFAYDQNGKRYSIKKGTRWQHINIGKNKIGIAKVPDEFDLIFNQF